VKVVELRFAVDVSQKVQTNNKKQEIPGIWVFISFPLFSQVLQSFFEVHLV
jgi:hypothetical protein